MKAIIEQLEIKYGSMRKAAVALGTSHQVLAKMRSGIMKYPDIELLERIRVDLKISKSKMWDLIKPS